MRVSQKFNQHARLLGIALACALTVLAGFTLLSAAGQPSGTVASAKTPSLKPASTIINTDITSNTTWTPAGSPYVVDGGISIASGVTLTIQAGVEVQFTEFSSLTANGRLVAAGNATQPITFTGTMTQTGWWNDLRIEGTDAAHPNVGSALSYVTVEYGGNYAADLYLSYATVNIDHSTFASSGGDGIRGDIGGVANISDSSFANNTDYAVNFIDGSVDPVLANLTASGNGHDGVALGSGTMTGDHVWEASGIPYILTNDETVAVTGTLTIQPGTTVQFEQFDSLTARGTLSAIGTSTQPITFTGTMTQTGWWNDLRIEGTDAAHPNVGSALSYVTVEYGGNYAADLYLSYATVNIDHSTFASSGGDGIRGDIGGVANISDSSFANNTDYAVNFIDGSVDPVLANLTANGNGHDGVALGYGIMTGNHIWEASGIPYILTNDETVAVTGTLTIQPGTTVQFEQFDSLTARGMLTATGTLTRPIVFTGSTPSAGWWNDLRIEGTDAAHPNLGSTMSYVTVEYGGNYAADLYLSYATVNIDHSMFAHSSGDGIQGNIGGVANISDSSFIGNQGYAVNFIDGSINPVLSNLSASGNDRDGVGLGYGTISGAHTWAFTDIPYYVTGDETLAAGGSLTVQPGVEARFEEFVGLTLHGPVIAEGTATQPITFTGTLTQTGWWSGLSIVGSAAQPNIGSTLQHVTVEYGGNQGFDVSVANGQVAIANSTLRYSSGEGLYAGPGAAASTIQASQIVNNNSYGVENADPVVTHTLLAANNWWGSANGPILANGCNPTGSGTTVKGNVTFKPFLTSADGSVSAAAGSAARILTLTPLRWFVPADGVTRAWVKITLRDGDGQPMSGRVVRLISTLGDVTDGGTTDFQGETYAYVTSDTPGEADLNAALTYQDNCETARGGTAKVSFTTLAGGGLLPDSEAPYMTDDIEVDPLPVTRGVPTTLRAKFTNPNSFPISVTVTFGFAQAGVGLTFGPLGEKEILIPANAQGAAEILWKPLISGHYCVQVFYSAVAASGPAVRLPAFGGSAQRNLDVYHAPLHTFHQRDTLNRAQRATNALSNAQTALDLATSPANVSGFFIPNYLFSQILGFNFSTWGKATNALAGDPPRQDYTTLATLDHYTVTPVQAGGGVTQARADAANVLMMASLDLTAKLRAAEISLDRYAGASEAGDVDWASQQTAAYLYYQTQAAQAMEVVADKLDAMVQEMQSEGIPDRVYTADQIRAYQDALRTGAYPAPGVYPAQGNVGTEAVQTLHLTDSDIQDIIQERLSVDPNDAAGSVYELVQQMATALRNSGEALLTPDSVFAISGGGSAGSPQGLTSASVATTTINNLIRAYPQSFPVLVGNPMSQTVTVELRVRPIDLPADWAATVSPVTKTLSPGEQFTATLTVAPAAPAVQGTRPRVAVEGYISNTLIGGVTYDIMLPNYVYFDGKVPVYLPIIMK